MHEGVVCTEIMELVTRAARENGLSKVYEILVSAGPYSCVNEGQLNFYLGAARAGTVMEEAVIRVERDERLTGASQLYIKSIKGD